LALEEIIIMGMGSDDDSAEKAHQQYVYATNKAIDFAKEKYQEGRKDIEKYYGIGNEYLDPYTRAGRQALDTWMAANGMNPDISKEDIYEKFRNSPGYQFAKEEGDKAVARNAAARGTTQSGALQKELLKYGQGMADQQYDTWLNRVAQTMGMGANAAGAQANNSWNTGFNLANQGSNLANAVGNMYAGQGASAANAGMAGSGGGGNIWGGVGAVAGGVIGGIYGGPMGATAGAAAGGKLGGAIGGGK
jgi:hypothetical protein